MRYIFDIAKFRETLDKGRFILSADPNIPLTYEIYGKKLGVDKSTISRLLSGKTYPSLNLIKSVFTALGIKDWENTYWVEL